MVGAMAKTVNTDRLEAIVAAWRCKKDVDALLEMASV